jgi:pilus assembly protein Flp/PilA
MKLFAFITSYFVSDTQRQDRGATVAEYALLLSLIAVIVIVGVTLFGNALGDFFSGLPERLGFTSGE